MKSFLCMLIAVSLMTAGAAVAQNTGDLFPELGRANGTQPKRESKDAGLIKIIIDNVQIINPPMNGISLCTGTLTMENNTNVTVDVMNLAVKYGNLSIPVTFRGVASYGKQDQAVAFAGENCKSFLNVPVMTVENCVAGPMTLGECQAKIKYVPIKGS